MLLRKLWTEMITRYFIISVKEKHWWYSSFIHSNAGRKKQFIHTFQMLPKNSYILYNMNNQIMGKMYTIFVCKLLKTPFSKRNAEAQPHNILWFDAYNWKPRKKENVQGGYKTNKKRYTLFSAGLPVWDLFKKFHKNQ